MVINGKQKERIRSAERKIKKMVIGKTMKQKVKRIICYVVASGIIANSIGICGIKNPITICKPCYAMTTSECAEEQSEQQEMIKQRLEDILRWEKESYGIDTTANLCSGNFLDAAGVTETDWYAFGIARSGVKDDQNAYLAVLREYIKDSVKTGRLWKDYKVTDLQRICITMAALGGDVFEDMGEGKSLFAYATYESKAKIREQGVNACIWSILVADCLKTKLDDAQFITEQLEQLLLNQQEDGSFCLEEDGEGDVDLTAMALQALAPHVKEKKRYQTKTGKKQIKQAVEKALEWLSLQQRENGTFISYDVENAESTAQVLIALCALGIDNEDQRFQKNGHTVLEALLSFSVGNGGYSHTLLEKRANEMSGQQVYLALVAYLRYEQQMHSLYDLRGEGNGHMTREALLFTEQDQKEADKCCRQAYLSDYARVIVLLDRLERAQNKDTYKEYEELLKNKKQQLEEIKRKIANINERIMKELYPLRNLSKEQENTLQEVKQEIEELGVENQSEIFMAEELLAYDTVNEVPYGAIGFGVLLMLGIGVIWIRRLHSETEE